MRNRTSAEGVVLLAPSSPIEISYSVGFRRKGSLPSPRARGVLAVILNHLNLAVSDVQQAREFLVKYFGLDPQGKPGNDADILRHCREPGEHARGSWVVDLLLKRT